ncbi:MAG: multiheme c-type cytochrome [Planctomycetaceae bacterium]
MRPTGISRGTALKIVAVGWALLLGGRVWAQEQGHGGDFRLIGTGGCTAANCHARPAGEDQKQLSYHAGNEYGIWLHRDPHAKAYAVLDSAASRGMAKRLGLESAKTAKVCLACHSTLSKAELDATQGVFENGLKHDPGRRAQLRDGVSCEACHGPAEQWLQPHKQAGWRNVINLEHVGFQDNRDTSIRAQACVSCHVGGPGRDVDHDLIAAGHPRLTFELAAYHRQYVQHWPNDKTGDSAELWKVGQKESALAALEQLRQRATPTGGKPVTPWIAKAHADLGLPGAAETPWPEFSELSCYACHHDLAQPSWRQARPGGSAGVAEWGSWTFALWPTLARNLAQPEIETGLLNLGRMVNDPSVARDSVAAEAAKLRDLVKSVDLKSANLASGWLTGPEGVPVREWDHAAQVVLALEASRPDWGTSLRAARRRLLFPQSGKKGFNSPRDFGGEGGPLTLEQFEALRAEWAQQPQNPPAK